MLLVIEAPAGPETAFDEVADFGAIDRWDPFVRCSTLIAGEPMQEGAVYSIESVVGLSLEYRIIDIERPRFVVYQGGTRRVRSTDTIEVEQTAGGVRISVSSELRFTGWIRVLSPVIGFVVRVGGRLVSLPAMRRHLGEASS